MFIYQLLSFNTTLSGAANCIHTIGRPSDLGVGVYAQAINKKVYTGSWKWPSYILSS